jgi:hypothetical protein
MVAARECQGLPPSDEAASTIQAATVVRVGSTCHTDYCSGVGQVYGVTLVVRAPQGVTAEPFAKILACHSAMVLAGTAPPLANDPYSLPDSWVGIGVKEEAGYFDVTLTGDSVSDNLRILQRAKALARSSTGEPPSPAR